MKVSGRIALLTALWLLAWGELSVANVITGVAVAAVLLAVFPSPGSTTRVRLRPLGILRLAGYVAAQLLTANVVMTREILRRRSTMRPGVVSYTLERPSEHVVTVMTSIISLSPGTMTADVDAESRTIHVHFLFLSDVEDARRSLAHLERLAVQAVSTHDPADEQPGVS